MSKESKVFYHIYLNPEIQFGNGWGLGILDDYLDRFKKDTNVLPNILTMSFKDYCYFSSLFNPSAEFFANAQFKYRGITIKFI